MKSCRAPRQGHLQRTDLPSTKLSFVTHPSLSLCMGRTRIIVFRRPLVLANVKTAGTAMENERGKEHSSGRESYKVSHALGCSSITNSAKSGPSYAYASEVEEFPYRVFRINSLHKTLHLRSARGHSHEQWWLTGVGRNSPVKTQAIMGILGNQAPPLHAWNEGVSGA
ncbi:hypothetical protein VNO77_15578 [Canavalia gladiata]|uniref:Uncharacterized protein n=1 Tax=Canavalia gladiata TaxID=3824 RepID=A0AAN9LZ47_CANGL